MIGLFLIIATYFYYPHINENKLFKNQSIEKSLKTLISDNQNTVFENVEYKGLYDFDKPFTVRSEKAHILNEEPDVVYMKRMYVNLNLGNGREVIIISDKGTYNKKTFDCFFEQNVKATDGDTKIFSENLDLLASQNTAEIYNNVRVIHTSGNIQADKIDYNFETKNFKVSMFNDKTVKVKVVQ